MTAEFFSIIFRSELQKNDFGYYIRNNANKRKASYFDAEKVYITFPEVRQKQTTAELFQEF